MCCAGSNAMSGSRLTDNRVGYSNMVHVSPWTSTPKRLSSCPKTTESILETHLLGISYLDDNHIVILTMTWPTYTTISCVIITILLNGTKVVLSIACSVLFIVLHHTYYNTSVAPSINPCIPKCKRYFWMVAVDFLDFVRKAILPSCRLETRTRVRNEITKIICLES